MMISGEKTRLLNDQYFSSPISAVSSRREGRELGDRRRATTTTATAAHSAATHHVTIPWIAFGVVERLAGGSTAAISVSFKCSARRILHAKALLR